LREFAGNNHPNGVTNIPKDAFKGCKSLRNVVLPDTVTSISPDAFNGCINLINNNIKNNIKCNQNLKKQFEYNLVIPENIQKVSKDNYGAYSNLESIEIPLKTEVDPEFLAGLKT